MSNEDARWELARVLYEMMEKLDPSDEALEWKCLDDRDRMMFYHAICAVLARRQLVGIAAGFDPNTGNYIPDGTLKDG